MSSAEDIRHRLEVAQRVGKARNQLAEHLRNGQLASAAAIAQALGSELPRHQVVRVDFARGRA